MAKLVFTKQVQGQLCDREYFLLILLLKYYLSLPKVSANDFFISTLALLNESDMIQIHQVCLHKLIQLMQHNISKSNNEFKYDWFPRRH